MAIAAACVVTLGSLVNHFALDDEIPDLDAGLEGSLNNWVTVVVSFTGSLAAALHALTVPLRRRWFLVLAVLLALLSFDDLVRLHERVGENLQGRLGALPDPISEHIETVIFAPVYGVVFLTAWAIAREVPARAARFLRIGLVFLVAAVLVDLGSTVTHELEEEGTTWPHATRISFEEGLEVAGWITLSAALVSLACLALLEAGRSSRPNHASRR